MWGKHVAGGILHSGGEESFRPAAGARAGQFSSVLCVQMLCVVPAIWRTLENYTPDISLENLVSLVSSFVGSCPMLSLCLVRSLLVLFLPFSFSSSIRSE